MAGKIAVALVAVVLVACSGTTGSVDWDKYPSSLQSMIDSAARRGDCSELQDMFDVWIEANQPSGRRTTDVTRYINDKIEERC